MRGQKKKTNARQRNWTNYFDPSNQSQFVTHWRECHKEKSLTLKVSIPWRFFTKQTYIPHFIHLTTAYLYLKCTDHCYNISCTDLIWNVIPAPTAVGTHLCADSAEKKNKHTTDEVDVAIPGTNNLIISNDVPILWHLLIIRRIWGSPIEWKYVISGK